MSFRSGTPVAYVAWGEACVREALASSILTSRYGEVPVFVYASGWAPTRSMLGACLANDVTVVQDAFEPPAGPPSMYDVPRFLAPRMVGAPCLYVDSDAFATRSIRGTSFGEGQVVTFCRSYTNHGHASKAMHRALAAGGMDAVIRGVCDRALPHVMMGTWRYNLGVAYIADDVHDAFEATCCSATSLTHEFGVGEVVFTKMVLDGRLGHSEHGDVFFNRLCSYAHVKLSVRDGEVRSSLKDAVVHVSHRGSGLVSLDDDGLIDVRCEREAVKIPSIRFELI
jgi:hypothetical protein